MIDEVEYQGKWRLPESDIWYDGVVRFTLEEGIILELYGTFNSMIDHSSHDIILGKTTEREITLVNNHYRSTKNFYDNNIVLGFYSPTFIIIGKHFNTIEDIQFRQVSFSLFNLFHWTGITGLKFDDTNVRKEYSINYHKPDDIKFQYHSDCEGNMTFISPIHCEDKNNKIELKEECVTSFNYQKKVPFKDLLMEMTIFQGFLTLMTFEQSYPVSVSFRDDDFIDVKRGNEKLVIRCIYKNTFYNSRYKICRSPLIRFNDIKEVFPQLIQNWYVKYQQIEPTMILLLNYFLDKYNFSNKDFVDIIKGLESFHRLTINTNIKLSERLKDLIRKYSNQYITSQIIDIDTFCDEVVDNRNYHTHYIQDLKSKSLSGEMLFNLHIKQTGLLISCVLSYVGFDNEFFEENLSSKLY